VAEGHGVDRPHRAAVQRAPGRRRAGGAGGARLLGAAVLAIIGASVVATGLIGLSRAVALSAGPLREASMSTEAQRFIFDRRALRTVAIDDLFPPVYHTTTAAPMLGARRDFTRIGVAPVADCGSSFDPGLARLLSAHPCGPVLRVGYTDASRTLVAIVGIAVLGTGPEEQHDVNAATAGRHDDLRPRAVAFPGTAAAAFGDPQRVAFRVMASDRAPFLCFAVVGFSDGRPASADQGQEALDQSGSQLAAIDLEGMTHTRLEAAVDDLWARRR
jgi:hypothetical protein